jgi:hypothetical protein
MKLSDIFGLFFENLFDWSENMFCIIKREIIANVLNNGIRLLRHIIYLIGE